MKNENNNKIIIINNYLFTILLFVIVSCVVGLSVGIIAIITHCVSVTGVIPAVVGCHISTSFGQNYPPKSFKLFNEPVRFNSFLTN